MISKIKNLKKTIPIKTDVKKDFSPHKLNTVDISSDHFRDETEMREKQY